MTVPASSSLKAILGPTNTGKTYFAIERMLAHRSGMIGLPLRLLAREVYQKVADRVGAQHVALVTGEERIVPASPRYWVATVEAMPLDVPVDCLAVDEIQVASDFERGHVFTNRILHARGLSETLLLGAATMAPVIRKLLPSAEIIHRPRFSTLTYAGSKKLSRQPRRSAIVAFSATQVYAIAELLRRERGGAAVVMGALSPRTRNAQVELYQSGEVDFLVATDAIGMGLNLDVQHVAFADNTKFDGHQTRPLTPAELSQIAGRAGRHMQDGTFGVTGRCEDFDMDLVAQLEGHDFDPVKILQWRNAQLDFSSLEALNRSLDAAPGHPSLTRVPVATDQQALEFLARNEAGKLATDPTRVELLWQCCQIPDYRGISPAYHGEIITRVFVDLVRHGHVDTDWIAEQVRFCDNTSGDIDTLSNRMRQVRTWTFVANRSNWLKDPTLWRDKTRDIEDRLSDALHERLTQRFVDRRTSVLMRHLRDKYMASPEVNERGEVSVEGHLIGSIEGFRFTLARSAEGDAKSLHNAAAQVVAPEIQKRAERLAGAPNEELILSTDGYVRWRGEVVANIAEGDTIVTPRIMVLADESLTGPELERVQDRLNLWLRHAINTTLEPVMALAEPAELEGTARGIAFQLYEHLGLMPRGPIADDVKGLDQDVRGKMRKLGIKFGAYHIYVPASLKPAPRELAIILYALKHGGVRQPGVSDLPQIVLSGRTSFVVDPEVSHKLYEIAGFKVAGRRAVRVDILERLADIIRPLISLDPKRHTGDQPLPVGAAEGNGFRVTVEMTSLLGTSGEDFASILTSLGYRVRRTPKVEAPAETAPAAETAAPDAASAPAAESAASDAVAPADTPATDAEAAAAPAPTAAATEAADDAVDAALNEAAMDNVEGVPKTAPHLLETIEADAISQATADLGAPAPAAGDTTAPDKPTDDKPADDKPADDKPAEPEFDEIWYPGGRRPDNARQRQTRRGPAAEEGAEGAAKRPPRAKRSNGDNRNARPEGGRPPRRGKQDGNGKPQGGKRSFEDRPPRREKAFDPDSPFAKLAVLRQSKPE